MDEYLLCEEARGWRHPLYCGSIKIEGWFLEGKVIGDRFDDWYTDDKVLVAPFHKARGEGTYAEFSFSLDSLDIEALRPHWESGSYRIFYSEEKEQTIIAQEFKIGVGEFFRRYAKFLKHSKGKKKEKVRQRLEKFLEEYRKDSGKKALGLLKIGLLS